MKILPLSVFLLLVRVCAMQTVGPYFKDFLTRLQAGISDVLDDQSHEAQAKLIKMKVLGRSDGLRFRILKSVRVFRKRNRSYRRACRSRAT